MWISLLCTSAFSVRLLCKGGQVSANRQLFVSAKLKGAKKNWIFVTVLPGGNSLKSACVQVRLLEAQKAFSQVSKYFRHHIVFTDAITGCFIVLTSPSCLKSVSFKKKNGFFATTALFIKSHDAKLAQEEQKFSGLKANWDYLDYMMNKSIQYSRLKKSGKKTAFKDHRMIELSEKFSTSQEILFRES